MTMKGSVTYLIREMLLNHTKTCGLLRSELLALDVESRHGRIKNRTVEVCVWMDRGDYASH